jgi:hypothetical protein
MQFFLFDFALAFVALLGYRTLVAVTRHRVPMVSLERRVGPHPQHALAGKPEIARLRRRVESRPVAPKHPLHDGVRRASPHRLINFW